MTETVKQELKMNFDHFQNYQLKLKEAEELKASAKRFEASSKDKQAQDQAKIDFN